MPQLEYSPTPCGAPATSGPSYTAPPSKYIRLGTALRVRPAEYSLSNDSATKPTPRGASRLKSVSTYARPIMAIFNALRTLRAFTKSERGTSPRARYSHHQAPNSWPTFASPPAPSASCSRCESGVVVDVAALDSSMGEPAIAPPRLYLANSMVWSRFFGVSSSGEALMSSPPPASATTMVASSVSAARSPASISTISSGPTAPCCNASAPAAAAAEAAGAAPAPTLAPAPAKASAASAAAGTALCTISVPIGPTETPAPPPSSSQLRKSARDGMDGAATCGIAPKVAASAAVSETVPAPAAAAPAPAAAAPAPAAPAGSISKTPVPPVA
mmetsp:Transcript_5656/g.22324  ORF Transcript_5656/g.22324 Transcript_5656/m.22324 type:complete len:330 (+) Transcript_5656:1468-2457(+)